MMKNLLMKNSIHLIGKMNLWKYTYIIIYQKKMDGFFLVQNVNSMDIQHVKKVVANVIFHGI